MIGALATSWGKKLRAATYPEWSLDFVYCTGFARSSDCIYLVGNWRHWACDVNFERRMCIHDRGVLTKGQNVEFFAVSGTLRDQLCAAAPPEWWEHV